MDEAGNTGRNLEDGAQPVHLILTLAVDESMVRVIQEHVRDTARRYCSPDCEEDGFEFHGKELFRAGGHFAGRPLSERVEIYDDLLQGIEMAGAEIVIRGVDKPLLRRRYAARAFHPHDIVLMYTIESIERLAREQDCLVLLVADEAKEIEAGAVRDLANYQEVGTSWGWKTEKIERIVDTIHFVPSHRNPAIQLTDCATFVAARMRKLQSGIVKGGPSDRAIEDLWTSRVEPFVRTDEVWKPTP